MADQRQRNKAWRCADDDGKISYEQATLATLMDIREELQAIHGKLNCYRVPRALDAMYELGVEARRRKRTAAKKRRATKNRS